MSKQQSSTRAIVLGGGGVTGIAWESGILSGLLEGGVALRQADAIIGTSAGAFVGAALASGYDMQKYYHAQLAPDKAELETSASAALRTAWYNAFVTGGDNSGKIGAAFGEIAKSNPEPVPAAVRRSVVEARLVTAEWPATLQVTVIQADTGELCVFSQTSGIPLTDAVSASGAVPGIWPLMYIQGQPWIDGGMVSAANARLAEGYDKILILAPMPAGYGAIPGAAEDAAILSGRSSVRLVVPDKASLSAIGSNPYDPARRARAAIAGAAQGRTIAAEILEVWQQA